MWLNKSATHTSCSGSSSITLANELTRDPLVWNIWIYMMFIICKHYNRDHIEDHKSFITWYGFLSANPILDTSIFFLKRQQKHFNNCWFLQYGSPQSNVYSDNINRTKAANNRNHKQGTYWKKSIITAIWLFTKVWTRHTHIYYRSPQ